MDALNRYLLTDKPEGEVVNPYPDRETYLDEVVQPTGMRAIANEDLPVQEGGFIPPTIAPERQNALPSWMQFRSGAGPLPKLNNTLEDDTSVLPPEMPGALKAPTMTPPKMGETRESLGAMLGGGRLTSPIPVASVPVQRDAAAPTTGVIAPTTGARAAEGAGGDTDEMDRLSSAANWIRAMETAGSAISGKNLRSGIAESLADRMKQVEALRLKRAERAEELAREDEQSASLVQQYKSLAAQGLVPELPLLDKLPPKQAASLIKTYGSLGGMKAREQKTQAEIPQVEAKTRDIGAATGLKQAQTQFTIDKSGRLQTLTPLEAEQKKAQTAKIYSDIDNDAKEFKLKEQAALAAPGKDEQEQKVKLNDLAEKEKGFGGYVTLAGDLAELERAAPGLVTQGKPPEWLTSIAQAEGQNWPRSADPKVIRFMEAYGKLANAERHRLYGSAQTEGEIKSFLQMLNDNPISGGPEVLATQLQSFGENVAKKATSTLARYNNVFSPKVVDTVLGGEFKPLYEKGGVFAGLGQKSPFVAAAPAAAAPAPAPTVGEKVRMISPDNRVARIPAGEVEARKAQGWKEAP